MFIISFLQKEEYGLKLYIRYFFIYRNNVLLLS